jgi:hypothetical protein
MNFLLFSRVRAVAAYTVASIGAFLAKFDGAFG